MWQATYRCQKDVYTVSLGDVGFYHLCAYSGTVCRPWFETDVKTRTGLEESLFRMHEARQTDTKFWWWDETQLLLSQLSQTRWAIPQETPPGWRRSGWISPHTFVTWCGLTGEMTHECCVSQWYQEFPDHLTRFDILDDSIRSQLTFFPVCYITRDIRVCTIRWHISECKVMTASWM